MNTETNQRPEHAPSPAEANAIAHQNEPQTENSENIAAGDGCVARRVGCSSFIEAARQTSSGQNEVLNHADNPSSSESDDDAYLDDPLIPRSWRAALECPVVLRDLSKLSKLSDRQMLDVLERWQAAGQPHPRVFLRKRLTHTPSLQRQ